MSALLTSDLSLAAPKAGLCFPAIERAPGAFSHSPCLRPRLAERVPPYRASRRPITEGLRSL